MADGHAAYDPDRLPWLADSRRARPSGGSTSLVLWALFATLLVAGVSYWMGMQSVREPVAVSEAPRQSSPAATVRLPEAVAQPPKPQEVRPPPLPEVRPAAEPAPVKIERVDPVRDAKPKASPRTKPSVKKAVAAPRKARARPKPAVKKTVVATRPARLQAWPADQSAGAYGRAVRVGTFASRRQAKQGWARIVRVYPGIRRLKAVVVPNPSLRTGQTLYRLQFGTTSQAHSAVLCQRMRIVGQSCVVVGLPASQGGVRR